MSTNWSRSRELLAHASDLSRSAAGLASASAAAGRHVPPCAEPVCHLAPVPGPNGSRIADAPRLAALLPPGERLAAAAQPPPGDAVLTSQNPAVHPLGFPCPDHSTEIQECHYIMQYSIGSVGRSCRARKDTPGIQCAGYDRAHSAIQVSELRFGRALACYKPR